MAISRTGRWALIAIIFAAVLVYVFSKQRPPDAPDARQPDAPRLRSPERQQPREAVEPEEAAAEPDAELAALIRDAMREFQAGPEPDEAAEILKRLRASIRAAPEEVAAMTVMGFLRSGEDAVTGLPFVVGPDGMMETVPSLRLALLDLLPSLDPLAALDFSRAIMDRRTTPDEYALALRNMAWNDLDGDLHPELTDRFVELVKSPWMEQPSAGVLEAFDIPVEVGGGALFGELLTVAREKDDAAKRAAFISMDRMILRDPELLEAVVTGPGWMDFAPQQRASLLSRLDITRPAQRELLISYLSATKHAPGELEYYGKIFPNRNYLHGHRLVTADEASPGIDEIAAADARVLAELENVAVQGAGSAVIEAIRGRLANR